MYEILENFDFLPKRIGLTNNNKEKFSTTIGIILSLLILSISVIFVSFSHLNKIISKEIQSVIAHTEEKPAPFFNFTEFFPFVVRIEDQTMEPLINDSIVSAKATYTRAKFVNGSVNYQTFDMNFSSCNISNFPNKYHKYFYLYKFETALCIENEKNPELNSSLHMNGSFVEETNDYFSFYAIKCMNHDYCITNWTVLDNPDYDKSYAFSLFNLEDIFNPQNSNDPGRPNAKLNYFVLNSKVSKEYHTKIIKTEIRSDMGIAFDDFVTTSIYSTETQLIDYSIIDPSDPIIGSYHLYSSTNVTFATRLYMKLPDALTLTLSFINAFLFLGNILVSRLIDFSFYQITANKIDWKDEEKYKISLIKDNISVLTKPKGKQEKPKVLKNLISTTTVQNLSEEKDQSTYNFQSLTKLKTILREENYFQNKFVFLSYFELLNAFCCRKGSLNHKYVLLSLARQTILESTDVACIVNSVLDVQMIKFKLEEISKYTLIHHEGINNNICSSLRNN